MLAGTIRVLRDEAKVAEKLRSEQERLNRVLRTVGAGNAVLFQTREEEDLVARMCEAIVEAGGYRMAWIGMVGTDEARTIRPVATAGHDDGYLSSAHISWGQAGIMARQGSGHPLTGEPQNQRRHIGLGSHDGRMAHPGARSGIRSIISLPMKGSSGRAGLRHDLCGQAPRLFGD